MIRDSAQHSTPSLLLIDGGERRISVSAYAREPACVAQIGEHILCKHEPPSQRFLPLLNVSNVSNNFGESASRSK
jgi:hypothetical protein